MRASEEHQVLCLSRKIGEEIVIGKDIVLKVLEVTRGRVKLGIQADPQVPIKRAELLVKPESIRKAA